MGWGSAEVIGALAAGVVLMGGFLAWERRAAYPMLPLAYFRRRAFAAANAVIFFQFVSLIGSLFFVTQLFQIGLGYSPFAAGVRILVWMAMPMLISPVAGALADRIGNRPFMVAGLILQAGGLGWLAASTHPGVGYPDLVAPLVISGIGIAMCFPTVANMVTASVPPTDVGVAAGTNNALNALGGVFGVAVLAAVFAAHGSYAAPASFIAGFRPAEWTAAAVAGVGVLAAVLAPGRAAVPGSARTRSPAVRLEAGHLGGGQLAQELLFRRLGRLDRFGHGGLPRPGEHDHVPAPVLGVRAAHHQVLVLQAVDQRDHRGPVARRAARPRPAGTAGSGRRCSSARPAHAR